MSRSLSRTRSVSIQDGWMAPTSTPRKPTSWRTARTSDSAAAFDAEYDDMPASGANEAIEQTTPM